MQIDNYVGFNFTDRAIEKLRLMGLSGSEMGAFVYGMLHGKEELPHNTSVTLDYIAGKFTLR